MMTTTHERIAQLHAHAEQLIIDATTPETLNAAITAFIRTMPTK